MDSGHHDQYLNPCCACTRGYPHMTQKDNLYSHTTRTIKSSVSDVLGTLDAQEKCTHTEQMEHITTSVFDCFAAVYLRNSGLC